MLYGASTGGGSGDAGTIFSLTPPASAGGSWTDSLLYKFPFTDTFTGVGPAGRVVIGLNGYLYSTSSRYATVFVVIPPATSGASWTPYPLHRFGAYAGDAISPGEGITVGKGGVLYGTSSSGGSSGVGTVYAVAPPSQAGGAWTERVLYSFGSDGDGNYPVSIPTIGGDGTLYGTTARGALGAENGCGLVFSLKPPAAPGGAWTETKLYDFQGGADGCQSTGGVVFGKNGILYGTTDEGGAFSYGTLYSLTPPAAPGETWTHTVLHSFAYTDGASPETSLVLGAGGALYGTTPSGGLGSGTVFAYEP